ncbi:MAG: undecaprenyldiphospho-muramoylpentapeptide beta-N-acetylglucosaminyltransferase [Chthoniobacterales bacterium]
MNTVIACGGTGGHLFPGLAVAEVLRERGHEVMLFISEKEIDTLAVSNRSEFRVERLPSIGLPSPFSPAILGFTRRFVESLSRCRKIYQAFKPHVVLGMGGFTSTAPVLAGRMRGIPTFVHESNAIPGKANRLTARMVRAVLLGFKECAQFFPAVRTEFTGTPIRRALTQIDQATARERFGLRTDSTTLLVMGGSQGASGINQAMLKSLPFLRETAVQIIHLCGTRDEKVVRDAYAREQFPAFVAPFYHAMEEAYSAADLAIARSGAASLSELAVFSLPSILIPFPYAADDHQTRNAEIFTGREAAVLLKESEIVDDVLARLIRNLLGDRPRLERMGQKTRALAPQDAAALVVETMERYSGPNHEVRL